MLHLSLLALPSADARWRDLTPYQAHQLAWKAFPGVAPGAGERPFLFTLDARHGHHALLVQSTTAPDWRFLDGSARVQTKQTDPARVGEGTRLRFFVRANPTVDRAGFADGKQRRVAVGSNPAHVAARMGVALADVPTREAQLGAWLARQGVAGGFAVEACAPGPTVSRVLRRGGGRAGGAPMTIQEVEFTGTLRVVDAARFASARASGIGRARGLGYGLLMVRPV